MVELEIQLDEIKEQYSNVIRNSNNKAQQKKMAFLERNLEQLTLVQKQVNSHHSPSGIELNYQHSDQSLWTKIPPWKRRLGLLSANCLHATNEYKILRPYFKMQIGGFRFRIRNLRHNCKLSKSVWIRLEASFFYMFKKCWFPNMTWKSRSPKGRRFTFEFWPNCQTVAGWWRYERYFGPNIIIEWSFCQSHCKTTEWWCGVRDHRVFICWDPHGCPLTRYLSITQIMWVNFLGSFVSSSLTVNLWQISVRYSKTGFLVFQFTIDGLFAFLCSSPILSAIIFRILSNFFVFASEPYSVSLCIKNSVP